MIKFKTHALIALALLLVLSCRKKSSDTTPQSLAPDKPVLLTPLQNAVCTTGENQTSTESTITFDWSDAARADSYKLSVKNLSTGEIKSMSVIISTAKITLARGTPYSWAIVAQTSQSALTTTSDPWRFYSSGDGFTSYAPFPSNLTYPALGASVNAEGSSLTLTWDDIDPDNDLISFDIYFGTTTSPTLLGNTSGKTMPVKVNTGVTYYWKVIAKDAKGNSSDSGSNWFSVN